MSGEPDILVSRHSAIHDCLRGSSEAIPSNHSDLVKFSRGDECYYRVFSRLYECAKSAIEANHIKEQFGTREGKHIIPDGRYFHLVLICHSFRICSA